MNLPSSLQAGLQAENVSIGASIVAEIFPLNSELELA